MPLRMLQYAAGIYEVYCREKELDKYSGRVLVYRLQDSWYSTMEEPRSLTRRN